MVIGNANLVKEINLNILRNVLKLERIASKPKLADLTGLSVVTINSLINSLIKNGEIVEDVALPSSGGRPAISYRFNGEFSLALVIYMHEEKKQNICFLRVINLYGEVIDKTEKIMNKINEESFNGLIKEMLLKHSRIKIIAFGMPGQEVNKKLVVIDYEGLRDKYFTNYIKEKFNLPVIFENDINTAVKGYCYCNDISEDKSIVGIYFPKKYPPGAGIYINGDIYKGRDGLAGEINNLPFNIDWENINEEELKDIIVKIILSFNCMYNPHTIVLYGEGLDKSIIDEVKKRSGSKIQSVMMSEIVISNCLNSDFEIGIKQVALKALEPTLRVIQ